MTPDRTLQPDYFDRIYAARADPWDFETSVYESTKYDETLAALPQPFYRRGLEIGCSIGVLTERLAVRCERLLAVDVSEAALARARQRCARLAQVDFVRMQIPDTFPDGRFDLVLLSEVGYYWSRADLQRAGDTIVASLETGGTLLLVHWTAPVHDYPLTGDDVHASFLTRSQPGGALVHTAGTRHPAYRLDRFQRR